MGKVIDALHDAMIVIEENGANILEEVFMNDIFSKIYDGGKLEPLTDYMSYIFGE